jgi:hypothetical protein
LKRLECRIMAKRHVTNGWSRASGLALALAALLSVLPASAGGEVCTHRLTFAETDLDYSKTEGYDMVTLRGARFLNRPGEPRLPMVPVRLALPGHAEVRRFSLTVRDSSELGGDYIVWPSQPPQSLSGERSLDFVAPLEAVYKSDRWYPETEAEVVGSGRLGGVTVCDIEVYPVRYHPASGKMVLLREMEIEIEYDVIPTGARAARSSPELVGSLVANREGPWSSDSRMLKVPAATSESEEISYLIVTCDSLKSAFGPLAAWKSRKGLPSRIITIEEIAPAYQGCDLQEKIRNCLKDYNSKYGTVWVLLGGDTDVIPDRKAYVPLSDKPYLPCDLYYSDLDGTWNADGDLYWGEVPSDNLDMYADVFVGRAPVSNRNEVDLFVDKVLTYEGATGLPTDHELNMLFAAEILWGDKADPDNPEYTDGGVAKDLIKSAYVPPRFSLYRRYESLGNLSRTSVMELLNQGMNIVNLLSHGQYHSVSIGEDALDETDFGSLVNGPRFGFLYAVTCLSGGFDQPACMGEAWVLSPEGGGFFLGNSRYGWNCPGSPGEGPSDYYDQSFFESVFITGFTNLGKAHADAKHEFVAESRTDVYMRYIMYGLNLLGDPETRLWIDRPRAMEMAFARVVPTGSQTFSVKVTSEGTPLSDALVCLSKTEEVYLVEKTDGQGTVCFAIEPAEVGTLYVTATKSGYLPGLGEASVVTDLPPGTPGSLRADEDFGPSAVLTWARPDDGDLIGFNIYRNTLMLPEFLSTVACSDTTYRDTSVVEGSMYYYWVSSLDSVGWESSLSEPCSLMVSGALAIPDGPITGDYVLISPNPFEGTVEFLLNGKFGESAEAGIYDVEGRRIRKIHLAGDGAGCWRGRWDARAESGRRLSPGIYMVRFEAGGEVSTHKVILLR